MKMNKKGFTLIELLAVIVVLAIIALIATPIVMNTINKAQEGADKNAAYNYIDAVESGFAISSLDNPGTYVAPTAVTTVDASLVKGTAPSAVALSVSDGRVVGGTISFAKNTFTVGTDGTLTLSK